MSGYEQGGRLKTPTGQPEVVIDLRDQDPLDFSDNPEVPVTATILTIGLLARASRLSYSIRSETPMSTWPESQKTLLEIMGYVREAAPEYNSSQVLDQPGLTSIFGRVYSALKSQSNIPGHSTFLGQMDEFLRAQKQFVEDPRFVLHEDISKTLRPYGMYLRSAAEGYFIDRFGPEYLENETVIPEALINHNLLREFTDQEYWRHSTSEAIADASWTADKRLSARIGAIAIHQQLLELESEDYQEARIY